MRDISAFGYNFIKVWVASILLIIGGLIYVIFRSESLIMFSWFDKLGLSENIYSLRFGFGNNDIYPWVIYNLPAALWLLAYLYVIDAIWYKHDNYKLYKPFLWLMPFIAFFSEFLQLLHVMPGTFDILDVMAYTCAVIIYLTINKIKSCE